MEAGIVVELGVESGGELIALAGGNDMSIDSCEGLAVVGGDRLDIGCTDESHGHIGADVCDRANGVETAQLTTVGITTHLDVHRAQTTFGE